VFLSGSLLATTIDPLLWEQLVNGADFVGIVECTAAGGIVARYRVVESWKGPPVGSELTIRVPPNYWGPQFPIALCEQRYLVTAFKSRPPSNVTSTTLGGTVPFWWRKIPAEYRLPLFQGRVLLPLPEGERPFNTLGSNHPDIESFKRDVLSFLALPPEAAEVHLLKALAHKYVYDERRNSEEANSQQAWKLRCSVAAAGSAGQVVKALLVYAASDPKKRGSRVRWILRQGGRAETLQMLDSLRDEELPFPPGDKRYIVNAIRERLGQEGAAERPRGRKDPTAPPQEELDRMRRTLKSNPSPDEVSKMFPTMTRFDPESMARYLIEWRNPRQKWQHHGLGYVWGSYFARNCGKERKAFLKSLLDAKESDIRVAAAVYLSLEDEPVGLKRLKDFRGMGGDPGAWAALTLARRGSKSSVSRALRVLASPADGGMGGMAHRNLQKRVLVLLSNSAKASGVAQPAPPVLKRRSPESQRLIYDYHLNWWWKNRSRIVLHDPWFPMLKEQRVD
jgi:hypothetical protein